MGGSPSEGQTKANTYAYIGRLVKQKNPLEFLGLARQAARAGREERFLLIGDGVLSEACDVFIAEEGLANVIRLRNYSDPWPVMNVIDGLVIASRYEGLPIALLESLAFGVPALSTDVGDVGLMLDRYGSGHVVTDGPSGVLPWLAFTAWADALPGLRAAAVAAIPRVLADFSSETLAETCADLFTRLIAEAPEPRGRGRRRLPGA